jgi:hypothetical protein
MGKTKNHVSYKEMSIEEAAYTAGFVDGEGSIYAIKERKPENCSGYSITLALSIGQCHLGVLEAVRDMAGNGRVISEKKMKVNHKDRWKLIWTPNQMRHLLPQLLPYLIVKHEQALIALEMLALKEGTNNYGKNNAVEQYGLYLKLRELNHRGVDVPQEKDIVIRQFKVKRPDTPTCCLPDCNEKHYGRGYCRTHYREKYEYEKRWSLKGERKCAYCGALIPQKKKIESKYCSSVCRHAANYQSTKLGITDIKVLP